MCGSVEDNLEVPNEQRPKLLSAPAAAMRFHHVRAISYEFSRIYTP